MQDTWEIQKADETRLFQNTVYHQRNKDETMISVTHERKNNVYFLPFGHDCTVIRKEEPLVFADKTVSEDTPCVFVTVYIKEDFVEVAWHSWLE